MSGEQSDQEETFEDRKETFEFDPSAGETVVEVVDAIAAVDGTSPTELTPPLNEAVDPEALEQCIGSASPAVQVSFRLGGYGVEVNGDGTIVVGDA